MTRVYITPSAYLSIAEWMKYREESGEIVTDDSWVMRDLWDTQVKISKGLVTIPNQLTSIGAKRLMASNSGSSTTKRIRSRKEKASISYKPFSEIFQNKM